MLTLKEKEDRDFTYKIFNKKNFLVKLGAFSLSSVNFLFELSFIFVIFPFQFQIIAIKK